MPISQAPHGQSSGESKGCQPAFISTVSTYGGMQLRCGTSQEGSIVFIFKELSLSFTYEFSRVAAIMEGICVTKQGIAEYRNIDQNNMTVWKAGDCNVVPTPFYLLLVHSLFVPSHSSPPLLLPLTALIPTPFMTL